MRFGYLLDAFGDTFVAAFWGCPLEGTFGDAIGGAFGDIFGDAFGHAFGMFGDGFGRDL